MDCCLWCGLPDNSLLLKPTYVRFPKYLLTYYIETTCTIAKDFIKLANIGAKPYRLFDFEEINLNNILLNSNLTF